VARQRAAEASIAGQIAALGRGESEHDPLFAREDWKGFRRRVMSAIDALRNAIPRREAACRPGRTSHSVASQNIFARVDATFWAMSYFFEGCLIAEL
jgi:hypothetical protein